LSHFKQEGKKCWEWDSPRNAANYGVLGQPNKRNILAHRYSFEFFKHKIPAGLKVLHKCDNPPCVNPQHLFTGTHKDNSQDSIKKGRHKNPPIHRGMDNILVRCPELRPMGEKHHSARLTEKQVRKIEKEKGSLSAIAKKYGLGKSHVSMIKRHQIWKHILAPHLVGKKTR
jgi:hypothetical protein